MKTMSKQTREAIILASLLLVLIVVAIFSIKGGKSPSAEAQSEPTRTHSSPQGATPQAVTNTGRLAWVDDRRVPGLVNEVKGVRSPFTDTLIAVKSVPPSTTRVASSAPPHQRMSSPAVQTPLPGGELIPHMADIGVFSVPKEQKVTRTLEWIAPERLRQALADMEVTVQSSGADSRQVTLVGRDPAFSEALSRLAKLDMPPPVPQFIPNGVVVTQTERYVALTVDGKYYTLLEGEAIPSVGWIVTSITPTHVTLTKGKQVVHLRLSGGSPL